MRYQFLNLLSLVLFALPIVCFGQEPFEHVQDIIKSDIREPEQPFVADFNGDGLNDVVVSGDAGQSIPGSSLNIYFNMGNGAFSAVKEIGGNGANVGEIFDTGDMDNDGDVDIIIKKSTGNTLALALNDGQGNFTLDNVTGSFSTYDIKVADMDQDGQLEIIVAAPSGLWIYSRSEGGNYSSDQIINAIVGGRLHIADMNNDNMLDIIVDFNVFIQGSNGVFSQFQVGDQDPITLINSITTADFNADGYFDLFYGSTEQIIEGNAFFDYRGILYYESLGNAAWASDHVFIETDDMLTRISAADIDQDGDLDIVTPFLSGYFEAEMIWLENKGLGAASLGSIPGEALINTFHDDILAVAADMDNDGRLDLVTTRGRTDEVSWFHNSEENTFERISDIAFGCVEPQFTQIIDVNNNGLEDFVTYCDQTKAIVISYRQGDGSFAKGQRVVRMEQAISDVEVYAINGDEQLDFVFSIDQTLYTCTSLADGSYGEPTAVYDATFSVANFEVEDFNENGQLDVVLAFEEQSEMHQVFDIESSNPVLEEIPKMDDRSGVVYIEDMNADGQKEVLFKQEIQWEDIHVEIFEKNETNGFDPRVEVLFLGSTGYFELNDFNKDGLIDMTMTQGVIDFIPATATLFRTNQNLGDFEFQTPEEAGLTFVSNLSFSSSAADIFNIGVTTILTADVSGLHLTNPINDLNTGSQLLIEPEDIAPRFLVKDMNEDGLLDVITIGLDRVMLFEQLLHPPIADFAFDECSVSFNNLSQGNYLNGSFHWDLGNGIQSNAYFPELDSYVETGSHEITLVACNQLACDTLVQTLEISHVFDYDIPTQGEIGEELQFQNLSQNFTNFTWVFGDGEVSQLENPTHSYNAPGLYQVEFYATDNTQTACTRTVTQAVQIGSLGLASTEDRFFSLQPNPSNAGTTITCDEPSWSYTLRDPLGRALETKKPNQASTFISTKHLAAGVYFLEVKVPGNRTQVEKLLVK